MVRFLLSLWHKIIKRESRIDPELEQKLNNLRPLLQDTNEDGSLMLGLALCLQELPKEILEYQPLLEGRHHSGYLLSYNMENTPFTIKELINYTLGNKKLIRGSLTINEGREKHLFLRGTILTINSVFYAIRTGKFRGITVNR